MEGEVGQSQCVLRAVRSLQRQTDLTVQRLAAGAAHFTAQTFAHFLVAEGVPARPVTAHQSGAFGSQQVFLKRSRIGILHLRQQIHSEGGANDRGHPQLIHYLRRKTDQAQADGAGDARRQGLAQRQGQRPTGATAARRDERAVLHPGAQQFLGKEGIAFAVGVEQPARRRLDRPAEVRRRQRGDLLFDQGRQGEGGQGPQVVQFGHCAFQGGIERDIARAARN